MQKILIANRGEIAVRIIDSCRAMNIRSVAVYSDEDRNALHVRHADEAVYIGESAVEKSYLNGNSILNAALNCKADGIHPGYGFLSENAQFARDVAQAKLTWIGPSAESMESMASKIEARKLALEHQVPVVPGVVLAADAVPDLEKIGSLGLPLLLKASAGGGGIGMREIHKVEDLDSAIAQGRSQAQRQFGDGSLLIERLLSGARHVEVQVIGDLHSHLLHLHERDCSLQRRRQKLIEEAPAPGLSDDLRKQLQSAALRLAGAVDYHSVGTVEFLVQGDTFFLLEMNTRLQVEHGVTELVCGLDLVQLQIEIAMGQPLPFEQDQVHCDGHAIEARVYAEDPGAQFAPSVGEISAFENYAPPSIRLDTGVARGSRVSLYYDGLLCKLMAHGQDRDDATRALASAMAQLCIAGVTTNQALLRGLLQSEQWREAAMQLSTLERDLQHYLHCAKPLAADIDRACMAATVWQFLSDPPAADQVPWPGGFVLKRHTGWHFNQQPVSLAWRWTAADRFYFEQARVDVHVLSYETDAPVLALEIDGLRQRFVFQNTDQGLCVWESQMGAVTLILQSSSDSALAEDNTGHCTSAGPGQVLEVLVEIGQSVSVGQGLIIVESMKMETTLTARSNGAVETVTCVAGDLVETGQLLVTIDQNPEVTE
ncbi:MAG: hypothetical protein HOC23_21140 [Halieaceae bacterium]|jgi:acetyl/propionyl-CoA carboxylase alpha subunit|nr:hypothetical protein [Halieaceae bacterium]